MDPSQTRRPRRALGAAFRFERVGKPDIVQPEHSEIREPDAGLWLFWIDRSPEMALSVVLEVGGIELRRDPYDGDVKWHETPTLARMIRLACA